MLGKCLLKKLILFILLVLFMYWLGKWEQGESTICFGPLFWKLVIICRAQWALCLAHTWKQDSGLDSGNGDIYTSPDTASQLKCRHA